MITEQHVCIGAIIAGLFAGAWLYRALWRWWRNLLLRRRFRRGRSGEKRARKCLLRQGYRILAEQLSLKPLMWIDGQEQEYEIRADFLVQKKGRRAVVEAKTGLAAKARARATRRQLLEYALSYDVDQVFLYDDNADKLREVRFAIDRPEPKKTSCLLPWIMGLVCGGGVTALVMTWFL